VKSFVADQEFPIGSYCPPVGKANPEAKPPQTIIFEPVHTVEKYWRPVGAFVVDVPPIIQALAIGSYCPPVFSNPPPYPPQTTIFEPVQTAAWSERDGGASVVAVPPTVHEFPTGSYSPPVFRLLTPSQPPHTIILEPVQTAEAKPRAVGAPTPVVADHESATGSYTPPVFE
jgi:hypothetical protein